MRRILGWMGGLRSFGLANKQPRMKYWLAVAVLAVLVLARPIPQGEIGVRNDHDAIIRLEDRMLDAERKLDEHIASSEKKEENNNTQIRISRLEDRMAELIWWLRGIAASFVALASHQLWGVLTKRKDT